MNGKELSDKINIIKYWSDNLKELNLYFQFDNETLIVENTYHKLNTFKRFSLSNLKVLLYLIKKERLNINKIEITY